jgi:hypothetical protein
MRRLQRFVIVGIVFLFLLVPLARATLQDGLVLYLPFDEGQGNVAKDSSGKKHDGTINNAEWVNGQFDKALKFNGTDSFVGVAFSDDFKITDGITLGAWVIANVPFNPAWRGIINARKSTYGPFLLQTGGVSLGEFGLYFKGAWTCAQTKKTLEKGVFHHLVGTYDQKNGMHIYYDGKVDESLNQGPKDMGTIDVAPNEGIVIGHNYGLAGRFWDGVIDEVVIYNRALSADEVTQLFKAPPIAAVEYAGKLATTWGEVKSK